ncbi:hypothetical protein B0H15DRAFT_799170 [Mycena belliarum]|uniref:Uncharacterized protein n=1 Tax=Mycena belliarum TaxID=1033014 RepID=A0AAD6U8Q6_9AGAR|nr:hypothetical protein B0H15DRAFT_799170 [Mycena belliae]
MPYIYSSSSGIYPGMGMSMGMGSVVIPSYGYPSHHHGYQSSRRHSSSGSYYGMPTQHYYPEYAYGGGFYGGSGYGHSTSYSRAPVIVTHSGHRHRSSSRSSSRSRYRSGW